MPTIRRRIVGAVLSALAAHVVRRDEVASAARGFHCAQETGGSCEHEAANLSFDSVLAVTACLVVFHGGDLESLPIQTTSFMSSPFPWLQIDVTHRQSWRFDSVG